jgi:hypothetical protein
MRWLRPELFDHPNICKGGLILTMKCLNHVAAIVPRENVLGDRLLDTSRIGLKTAQNIRPSVCQ